LMSDISDSLNVAFYNILGDSLETADIKCTELQTKTP